MTNYEKLKTDINFFLNKLIEAKDFSCDFCIVPHPDENCNIKNCRKNVLDFLKRSEDNIKTNYEYIQGFSIEEMINMIDCCCSFCYCTDCKDNKSIAFCDKNVKKWLEDDNDK